LPTVDELKALANQTWLLTDELNTARLEGFLSEALAKRRQQSNDNFTDA
jgi:hypothetical protein